MGNFIKICNSSIEKVMKKVSRQYFVGNLQRPQVLDYILDHRLEIGITDYAKYSTEPVHYHTETVEYQYMISGWTEYLDVATGEVFEFKKGDFYCIEGNTIYAQKSQKGTRILFIKVPSLNDKHEVDIDAIVQKWYEEGLSTVRKDYFHEETMPEANSIQPAVAVAIIRNNKILILKRRDNKKWTMPGGTMEIDESIVDCAVREVKEETGLHVNIIDFIGTYTDPDVRIEYSDGEVRREFTIVYLGSVQNDEVIIDDEAIAFAWMGIDSINDFPMSRSQKRRIQDVMEFYKSGKKRMG